MIFDKIADKIKNAKSVAIFSHTRPDGDTIGGVLALKIGLQSIGKICDCFCDNAIGKKFNFLPQVETYKLVPKNKYDLYIAVDCGELARLGENAVCFQKSINTVNIDHHYLSNDNFASLNCVEHTASTCELVYELLSHMNIKLNKDIAICLYTGLSTDTGNFAHSNTSEHVFKCAQELIKYDINVADLNFILYRNTSVERTKLLGKVISRIRRYCDDKISLIYTLIRDMEEMNAAQSDTEGFIDYATNVVDTEVGIALCQHNENSYKISMRSRGKVDVSKICAEFGGGGHKNASGCMLSGLLEEVIEKVVRAVSLEL